MSDLSPLSGEERKSNFGAVRSVDDPTTEVVRIQLARQSTHWPVPYAKVRTHEIVSELA
jgi:hypothetical protein